MTAAPINVAVLGSTGSVGRSALEVIEGIGGPFQVAGLSAFSQLELLEQQAQKHRPRWIVAADEDAAANYDWNGLSGIDVKRGPDALERVASDPEVDTVVAAIVGSAGLRSTWAAIEAGKRVALANKETLVMAGGLVMELASKTGCELLPVDSEHSAVFQAAQSGGDSEIRRIVLTASGGPFRNHTAEQLQHVTREEALAHPTWEMGEKITIDSATMMNKALEVIEASWLFGLEAEEIEVSIHPQSIVHSLVEFVDGSVVAQLSPPDMKLPIQYALTFPERVDGPTERLDLSRGLNLELSPPDFERFPALRLGFEAARTGGTSGAVLNAANEAAVAAFLAGEIRFVDIVPACQEIIDQHNFDPNPTLDELIRIDGWARQEIDKWIAA